MSARFEELDWQETPLGELALRRRRYPGFAEPVYEIKLNDDFLMSSLFTVAEEELANLALAELSGPAALGSAAPDSVAAGRELHGAARLDVVVGGLGLGCTALAALRHPEVGSLLVVDALDAVIGWHERGLLPGGVAADPRCRLVHGDFFAMIQSPTGLDPADPERRFHAIVVDIDHSPRHLLHPGSAGFYGPDGLRCVAERLHPGGVFSLWSNDPPDDEFLAVLGQVFTGVRAVVVSFANPLQDRDATNTVYLARTPGAVPHHSS
ncbi:spermidine synthase [Streptacidiphilus sp. MAP5-3]|uniref:spermidine synthase n=1 Tax=unclassified Streptacidiphilus TaxID=2643834 RepID=UPI003517A019